MFVDIVWSKTYMAEKMKEAIKTEEGGMVKWYKSQRPWRIFADVGQMNQELELEEGEIYEEPATKKMQLWKNDLLSEYDALVERFDEVVAEKVKADVYITALEGVILSHQSMMFPAVTGTDLKGTYRVMTADYLLLEAHKMATVSLKTLHVTRNT